MTTATGFAEMFEWHDGNKNNEDRTGTTVTLLGDKICAATATDLPENIIGVIGGDNTAISAISNASPHEWHGKHLRDKYNKLIWEPQVMVEWVTDGYRHWYEADRIPAGVDVPADATFYRDTWNGHKLLREILSEEYKNPNGPVGQYLPRWERQEWGIVVLVGRAIVNEGCMCNPAWKKLKQLPCASAAEWLVR